MSNEIHDEFLNHHLDQSLVELSRLCAVPSVSAKKQGQEECALLLKGMLEQRGFKVEIAQTKGAPVVSAFRPGRSKKTLILYNHYDVQPVEPLELWDSSPFEAVIKNGRFYARGANDDKGHITSRLFAIDALLDSEGDLPCTLKWVIEGEEEVSSVHLEEFMIENKQKLSADACIWESGGVDYRDVPTQYLGMRGICYVELSVETANQDVHSGLGGSIFPNAAWRLVWALNSLKGPDETIRISGFYDHVRQPSPRDIELMQAMPETAQEYKNRYGLKNFLKGLRGGVDLRLEEVFKPTCTICGLSSGYEGPGSKTVLPAKATAKVDFRLVPDQTPAEILPLLRAHLDSQGFEDVKVDFLGGEAPARTDPDHPFVKLVADAAREVYKKDMQIIPMIGGSGPNAIFTHTLGVPIASSGIGDPASQAHAPNESIRLDLYLLGCQHMIHILKNFGD
jgi:acetylornithine deacetylase/succinyl-diaminopimelate desuccinylase-like protein